MGEDGHMKKRNFIKSIAALVAAAIAAGIFAFVPGGVVRAEEEEWREISGLVTTDNNINSGGNADSITRIRLTGDARFQTKLTVQAGTLILDLNGYTFNEGSSVQAVDLKNNTNLIVMDSSADHTGVMCGNNSFDCITLNSNPKVNISLENITVRGGKILVTLGNGSTLTMNECIVTGFTGGAITVGSGCTFTMNGGSITGNQGSKSPVTVNGTFNMNNADISNNSSGSKAGGAVYVSGGTFNMTGGTLTGNRSTGSDAGAVYVTGGNSSANITGATISGNSAKNRAGALYAISNGRLTVRDTVISDNHSGLRGGGICVANTTVPVVLENVTITGNSSGSFGGGICVYSGSVQIDGTMIVTGNEDTNGTSNLGLEHSGQVIIVEETIDPNSEIGISTSYELNSSGSTITSGTVIDGIFFSDTPNNVLSVSEGQLVIAVSSVTRVLGYSLTLDQDIGVNYYVNFGNDISAEDIAGARMYFTVDGTALDPVAGAAGTVNGETSYAYTVNVNASQMTVPVSAVLKKADGTVLFEDHEFTVMSYAEALIRRGDAASDLAKAMLNYGAAAQARFGVNTANPANSTSLMTDAERAAVDNVTASDMTASGFAWDLSTAVTGDQDSISYYGASVVFLSRNTMRLYFKVLEGSIEDYTFTSGGSTLTPVRNGGYYYVEIPDIGAASLGTPITVSVNGGLLTVTHSPMTYAYVMLDNANMGRLARAFYLYYEAAKGYYSNH